MTDIFTALALLLVVEGLLAAVFPDLMRTALARLALAPRDALFDKTVSNMQEVMARHGKVVLISDAAGIVDQATAALGMLTSGSISRTLYTLGRTAQDHQRGRELPWVALAAGVVPVLGIFAYPLQIAWASRADDDLQAQFMALLSLAEGNSFVTEKIYPERFMHVAELQRMGGVALGMVSDQIAAGRAKLGESAGVLWHLLDSWCSLVVVWCECIFNSVVVQAALRIILCACAEKQLRLLNSY